MLYTVGHTKSYEQGLEEKRIEGDVLKKNRQRKRSSR